MLTTPETGDRPAIYMTRRAFSDAEKARVRDIHLIESSMHDALADVGLEMSNPLITFIRRRNLIKTGRHDTSLRNPSSRNSNYIAARFLDPESHDDIEPAKNGHDILKPLLPPCTDRIIRLSSSPNAIEISVPKDAWYGDGEHLARPSARAVLILAGRDPSRNIPEGLLARNPYQLTWNADQ